jgi:hypothetical protein
MGVMGVVAALPRKPARVLGAALLVAGLAGGLLAGAAGSAAARQSPATAASGTAPGSAIPQPGGREGAQLQSVRCTSSSNCWAVGTEMRLGEALHWNGRTWALVGTPSPGTFSTVLESVACTSSDNCWAVGSASNGTQDDPTPTLTVALRWNGILWSVVPTPSPGGAAAGDSSDLLSVTCVSAADCWATGSDSSGAHNLNLALHWNGHAWSAASTPDPLDSNELASVRCTSAADCWAVGSGSSDNPSSGQALHWNGRAWSLEPTPDPRTGNASLTGAGCTSSASCWAVGSYGGFNDIPRFNLALRWNGQSWAHVLTPDPAGSRSGVSNVLAAVNCRSATYCWAVGSYSGGGTAPVANQVLHWDGTQWSQVHTANPGGTVSRSNNNLFAIACPSRTDCWAVGSFSRSAAVPNHNRSNQILHWNGTSWSAA